MKTGRRKFLKLAGMAVGAATILGGSRWIFPHTYPGDTKNVFSQCGACSRTFYCLLNREFGSPKINEEKASEPMAGGLLSTQQQCGMLWGSSLAAGAESFRRFPDRETAIHMSMTASQKITKSFYQRTKTLNCRDIVGFDMTNKAAMAKFMVLSIPGSFSNMVCMNLAEQWAPEAIQAAKEGLASKQINIPSMPLSCASELARTMKASDEEIVTVSGLAGGIGLSGHACGALGAAIWLSSLKWCRNHPNESGYSDPKSKEILEAFRNATHSEMTCSKITGRTFENIAEHSDFIKSGGCRKLIDILAKV